jgi:alpha-tubulin suppressor-like RCC1 family protein
MIAGSRPVSGATTPFASSLPAVGIRPTGATLRGMVVPNGEASLAWFEWGPSGNLTNRTPATNVGSGLKVVLVRQPILITNPMQNGWYEFRLVVGVSESFPTAFSAKERFTSGTRITAWGDSQFGKTAIPAGLSSVVAAAAGWNQSYAIKPDGALVAWGDNTYGQTNIPASATNVVRISGGQYHNLALKADGRLLAWGLNIYGQAAVPTWVSNDVVMAAAGKVHNVALKANGTVTAWGANSFGQTTVPSGLNNVVAIAAAVGGEHNLALRADGTVAAWGRNDAQQCQVPQELTIPETAQVVAVAAGGGHSLALKGNGTVVAWGLNNSNQCNVPALAEVVAIAAGLSHSLALKADGTVVTWGGNLLGQTNQPAAVRAVVGMAAGNNHNLVMGGFNAPPRSLPQTVQASVNRDWVITLRGQDATGEALRFRITALPGEGTQYRLYQCTASGARGERFTANSWVNDPQGRVVFEPVSRKYQKAFASFEFVANDWESDSDASMVNVEIERFVSFTLPPTEVHPTEARLWGLAAPDGRLSWAWFEWWLSGEQTNRTPVIEAGFGGGLVRLEQRITGLASRGLYGYRLAVSNELGEVRYAMPQFFATGRRPLLWGNNIAGLTNVPAGLTNAVSVASRANVMLALDAQGKVWAWGSTTSILTAVPAGLDGALALAAGATHNVALKADRTVAVWGDNSAGQMNVPAGLGNVVAVAAGDVFSLALKADGKVVGWSTSPNGACVVPAYLDNVVGVAAGAKHAVALRGDGRLVAWGDNAAGQTNVTWLSNVVTVAGGLLHNVALMDDGTVAAWGDNSYGQCNVPLGLTGVVAVNAGVYHSLALRGDGSVVAWGQTNYRQVPAPSGLPQVATMAGGQRHSAVLAANTGPEAWAQSAGGAPNRDLVIALGGRDLDGDALTFAISGLPTRGELYQWDATVNGRGARIANTGATVRDSKGQVVFAPLPGEIGAPYATFEFRAVDGLTSSAPATVTISIQGVVTNTPPTITAQPQSRTNVSGSVVQFTVEASGTGPMSYQWRRQGTNLVNGGNVSGAAAATLTLSNITVSDAGSFTVVLSNLAGSLTSQAAQLTVWFGPRITTQPQSRTNLQGTSAAFYVTAAGNPEPRYQWQRNGVSLPGETSAWLTLAQVTPGMAGAYRVVVSNAVGTVVSGQAVLDVVVPPQVIALGASPFMASVQNSVIVTNVIIWPQEPQRAGTYRFSLCGNPPAGASINPTNGIFRWTPALAQSHQNFTVEICVQNLREPAWIASTSFVISVDPYLRFSLGRAVVRAGEAGSVSVVVSGSTSFSNLVSVLLTADERLGAPALVHPETGLPLGEVSSNAANQWELRFDPKRLVTQQDSLVACLKFQTIAHGTSTAVPLVPVQISATEVGGQPMTSFVTDPGRVIVIGSQDAGYLEALQPVEGAVSMAVYGLERGDYELESSTAHESPQWHSVWTGSIPSSLTTNVVLRNWPANPASFFRLKRP